jgi:hypothetical protein
MKNLRKMQNLRKNAGFEVNGEFRKNCVYFLEIQNLNLGAKSSVFVDNF